MTQRLVCGNELTKLDHGDSMRVDHAAGVVSFIRSNGERLEFLDTDSEIRRRDDKLLVLDGGLNMSQAANLAELIAATHSFAFEVIRSDAESSVYRFIDPKA